MISLRLLPIPNQKFSFTSGSDFFDVTIKFTGETLAATVSINNLLIISGFIITADTPLIPYRYIQKGNFFLLTRNQDIPDYQEFGVSQTLIYATQDEINVVLSD